MFSIEICCLNFFMFETVKMVANDGKTPTRPDVKLDFALRFHTVSVLLQNQCILTYNTNMTVFQSNTEFTLGEYWVFALICHHIGTLVLKKFK